GTIRVYGISTSGVNGATGATGLTGNTGATGAGNTGASGNTGMTGIGNIGAVIPWQLSDAPSTKGSICMGGNIDGRFAIFTGGLNTGGEQTTGLLYDTQTDSWSLTGALPVGEYPFGLIKAPNNGLIYQFGPTRVQTYNPATNTWTNLMACPGTFANNAGNLVCLLTTGPYAGQFFIAQATSAVIYRFDPTVDTFYNTGITNCPVTTQSTNYVAGLDGRLWRVGGTYDNTLYVYDPVANTWTSKAALPAQTWNAQSAVMPNGDILLVGGYTNRSRLSRYNVTTNIWGTPLDLLRYTRESHALAQLSTSLFAVFGGTQYNKQIEMFGSTIGTPAGITGATGPVGPTGATSGIVGPTGPGGAGSATIPVLVQSIRNIDGVVRTTTALIPTDDTIPQNTEGTQFYSVNITPTKVGNRIRVTGILNFANSVASTITSSLYVNTGADAVISAWSNAATTNATDEVSFVYEMTAASLTQITFYQRAGGNVAGTLTINGYGGNRIYGGVLQSGLVVEEYDPAWAVFGPTGNTGPQGVTGATGPTGVAADSLHVYLNSAANSANNTYGKVPYDTVSYDTNSIWDATNKYAIPKKAGYYLVSMRARTTTSGGLVASLYKNGVMQNALGTDAGSIYASGASDIVYCNGTTDYIEGWCWSGSIRAFNTGITDTWMSVIGPLNGVAGNTGLTGMTGNTGGVGAQGLTGNTGFTGFTGNTGMTGQTGYTLLNGVWQYVGTFPGNGDTLQQMNDGRLVCCSNDGGTWFLTPPATTWVAGPARPTATGPNTLRKLTDGRMLAIGTTAYGANCYVLSADGTSWVTTTDIPTGRSLFSAGRLDNGDIAVFGGWNGGYVMTAYSWNPGTQAWTALAVPPRNSLDVRGIGLSDGRVISMGGYSAPAGSYIYTRATNSYVSYATGIVDSGTATSGGITWQLSNNRVAHIPCTTSSITIFDGNTNTFSAGPSVPYPGNSGGGCNGSLTDPDIYYLTLSGRLYIGKLGNTTVSATEVKGPTGATGSIGTTGITGITGTTGTTGVYARTSNHFTTSSVPANSTTTQSISLAKTAELLTLTTDYPAWIRIYGNSVSMVADSGRLITVDPVSNSGIYLDILTTAGTYYLSPIVMFTNLDISLSNTAYISVTNKDITSRAITVTLNYLPLET
ncbi:MAG: hypothetical protein JHC33_13820, partial [Ignisphaera sp.]|nr:hypothetical protein [Ignisphaera sp.]